MTSKVNISVVVPVYNEEKSLKDLYKRLSIILRKLDKYEIIFVDDGSEDSSFRILKEIYKGDRKHVNLVSFRKNYGKGAALSLGFTKSRGNRVVTIDADLQDDPENIPKMLGKLESGFDVVSGWKTKRRDKWSKKVVSYLFNKTISYLIKYRIHDINCGLKAYKKNVLDEIDVYGDLYRFIPLMAYNSGYKITEVAVSHFPRRYGKSKYGWRRLFGGFVDLTTVIFLTKFQKKPAHFFGLIGSLFLLIGVISDGYVTFLKIYTGTTQGHIPLLLFGILMIIVGVQLISLGLLGELLVSTARKENYSIKFSSVSEKDGKNRSKQ